MYPLVLPVLASLPVRKLSLSRNVSHYVSRQCQQEAAAEAKTLSYNQSPLRVRNTERDLDLVTPAAEERLRKLVSLLLVKDAVSDLRIRLRDAAEGGAVDRLREARVSKQREARGRERVVRGEERRELRQRASEVLGRSAGNARERCLGLSVM
jgi:hypothetical protein